MEGGKKPRPGDVFELQVEGSVAYLQYLGKHPSYGDAIRILHTKSLPATAQGWCAAVAKGYIVFYPLRSSSAQGLVSMVGHHDKALEVPRTVRRAGARDRDGRVRRWIIVEGDRIDSSHEVLTAEQRMLPIAGIWNHAMLCKRVLQGWRPEEEA